MSPLQLESSPHALQLEKSPHSNEAQHSQKQTNKNFFFKFDDSCFKASYFILQLKEWLILNYSEEQEKNFFLSFKKLNNKNNDKVC